MKTRKKLKRPDPILDPEKLTELTEGIIFRNLSAADTKIPSRVLSHWKKEGLLPSSNESRKWVRISLIEFVWLKIVQQLRAYGCSFETIRSLKSLLLRNKELTEGLVDTKENLQRSRMLITTTMRLSDDKIDDGIEKLKSKRANQFAQEVLARTLLTEMIYLIILVRNNPAIYIDSLNRPGIYSDDVVARKSQLELLNSPIIYLPIRHFLIDIIEDEHLEDRLPALQLLTDDELSVLRSMRRKDFKEIIIRPDDSINATGKYRVITVKEGSLTQEQQDQITEILGLKNYQSITLKKRGNSKIYFERNHLK